ncbi:NifU family protein [Pseudonocardia sp. H11422]|uniref:NifU family protein n=1 Tax=Pseudonocardia sp. H11422 TaxID=2835866 RepID=UPI001BDD6F68|nr:NifU family protein [Pseudonocardia sp. H11422]
MSHVFERASDALLSARVRIRGHAGDVTVERVQDGQVEVEFHGACRSCPALAFTYASVVEPALANVPGVRSVTSRQVHASRAALDRIQRALNKHPGERGIDD